MTTIGIWLRDKLRRRDRGRRKPGDFAPSASVEALETRSLMAVLIDFSDASASINIGDAAGVQASDHYAAQGVTITSGDVPTNLKVGDLVALANPVAEFEVVSKSYPGAPTHWASARDGRAHDVLFSFSTPVTSLSLNTDLGAEGVGDVLRLLALHGTALPGVYQVVSSTEALDNKTTLADSLVTVADNGAPFSFALLQLDEQEFFTDLSFTPVASDPGGGGSDGGGTGGGSTGGGSIGGGSSGGTGTPGSTSGGGSSGTVTPVVQAPPTIVAINAFGIKRKRKTTFQGFEITFSKGVNAIRATNRSNYTLVDVGKANRKRVVTRLPIAVQYNADTNSVRILTGRARFRKPFILTVKALAATGIVDLSGRLLDGNGDGQGGDDATFRSSKPTTRRLPFVVRF